MSKASRKSVSAPVQEGVAVKRVSQSDGHGFSVETSAGNVTADAVVLAVSAYHVPNIPRMAERIQPSITQLHSSQYRNGGAVAGWRSARRRLGSVRLLRLPKTCISPDARSILITGSAPRCPRVLSWPRCRSIGWTISGQYDLPVDEHPKRARVRKQANHYLTGRGGGRDIDLRQFALEGMQLYGRLQDVQNGKLMLRRQPGRQKS